MPITPRDPEPQQSDDEMGSALGHPRVVETEPVMRFPRPRTLIARHDRMHPSVHDELMVPFAHDDVGYRDWLVKHPGGYVINAYMNPSPSYFKASPCELYVH